MVDTTSGNAVGPFCSPRVSACIAEFELNRRRAFRFLNTRSAMPRSNRIPRVRPIPTPTLVPALDLDDGECVGAEDAAVDEA